jgi:dihydroorotate dehydrogenase/NAD-dependent dihydropyrimidine dehydrogenase PreA subunit
MVLRDSDYLMPFEAAGLKFRNNLIVASGPTVRNLGMIKEIEAAGWGGASLKLAIDPTYLSKPPRYRWVKKFKYHAFTAETRLTFDQGLRLMEQARKATSELVLYANMSYAGPDPEAGWAEMANRYEAAGAHVIELNMCCPNMSFNVRCSGGKSEAKSGASVGSVPELVFEAVQTVMAAVNIPVFVKLTPEGGRIAEVAQACFEAGAASAGTTANRLAIVDFDIETPERGIYHLQDEPTLACMSGPWVRPLALRDVYEMRSMVGPEPLVMGSGGVESWKDAVRFIMAGADFVQVCTATMLHGYGILPRIVGRMKRFMIDQGHNDYRNFRDAILTHITPAGNLTIHPGYSRIDSEKCNGCGLCVKIGHCYAITMEDEVAVVRPQNCTGCATCTDICPRQAAGIIEGQPPVVE